MAQTQTAAGSTGTTARRKAGSAQTQSVSKLVTQLLTGDRHLDYDEIAERVRRRIPDSQTTARSIASLATGLRAAGLDIPDRRRRDMRH